MEIWCMILRQPLKDLYSGVSRLRRGAGEDACDGDVVMVRMDAKGRGRVLLINLHP